MMHDGCGVNLACELNGMVSVKVTWCWHDLKSHNYGGKEMVGYGITEKEMEKGELSREGMCCIYKCVIFFID